MHSPRIAIVTGAAQGIGESIALRLADDGLDVVVTDLPAQREKLDAVFNAIKQKGRRSLALVGDVSVDGEVIAMVGTTVQEFGGLDVMIANAGVFSVKPFLDTNVEDLDRTLSTNTRGVFLCFKHAANQMVRQGRGGRLIAAASVAAKQGFPYTSTYCASKFAVRGLVQCAAAELKSYNINITANAYAPSVVPTPMTLSSEDESNGGPCATLLKMVGLPTDTKCPDASEISELVSYMVKPEAHLLTGQCISINGGLVMD